MTVLIDGWLSNTSLTGGLFIIHTRSTSSQSYTPYEILCRPLVLLYFDQPVFFITGPNSISFLKHQYTHWFCHKSLKRAYTQPCTLHASTFLSHHHEVYPLFYIDNFFAYEYEPRGLSPKNWQRWTGYAMLSGVSKNTKHDPPFSGGNDTTSFASAHWCLVVNRRWRYDGLGVTGRTFDISRPRRTRQPHRPRSIIFPFTQKFSFFCHCNTHTFHGMCWYWPLSNKTFQCLFLLKGGLQSLDVKTNIILVERYS